MIPERGEPNSKIRLYITWRELTFEDGTDEVSVLQTLSEKGLGDFSSFRALYSRMYDDNFPVCPFCGKTPIRERHVENCQEKPPRSKTDVPEAAGRRQKLPQAAAAIPDFQKVLRHLEEWELPYLSAEESWLEGKASDGSFQGKRFISRSVWDDSFTTYREEYSAEDWAELCARYGADPEEHEQLSIPEPQMKLGGVFRAPSDRLVALIAISALTPMTISSNPFTIHMLFEDIVRSLHLDPENIDWDQINKKTANLERAARHLAVLVRGGTVGSGNSYAELSEHDHSLVSAIDTLRKRGLEDEEIAEHINARYVSELPGERPRERKTANDIRRISEFGLKDLD